jgi:hypothetical protein
MPASTSSPEAAAIATKLYVRAGAEALFIRWQARLTHVISGFPGFLSIEMLPLRAGSSEWRVVQQFRTAELLEIWARSAERRKLLDEAASMREGKLEDESVPDFHASSGVTEVIVTTVKPGQESAFRAWCENIQAAQGEFPGYMGTYVQSPISAAQPFWTTRVRFSQPEQLEAWLASTIRHHLIRQSEQFVDAWESHRMPTAFSGWFPPGVAGRKPPAAWKQTGVVLLVLFPIVMLELRYLSPLLGGLNPAAGTFIGNAISVSLVSWPLASIAIRALDWWLQPPPARRLRAEILGGATLVALYAMEIGFFWRFL